MNARSGRRRWLVAGGGTGGHVTLALALGERIAERGGDVLFLGSERGFEKRLVPEAGFPLETLATRQVMGQSAAARVRALLGLPAAVLAALRVLRRFRAEIVVSVGGYAAPPAVLAAALRRTPVAVVEPNAIPGRANRASARFARRVFVGFESAAAAFGARRDRVRCHGIPLRRALVADCAQAGPRRRPAPPFRLLVAGGSQGARQLNEAMIAVAPRLERERIEIFHQSGDADRARVAEAYAAAGLRAEVVAFEADLSRRYRWADLALCRAGALTVAELALAGLPALLVPYPFAADDHQRANARELESAGAAQVLDPRSFGGDTLGPALAGLLGEPGRLREMGACAAKLARPEAAERIVEECEALLATAQPGPQGE